jgi:choline dehydrogenase-like flavoprotein
MSFDAIIVGSGATGSWAAKLLTEGGLTVALLEAGTLLHADAAATGARQGIQSQCYAFNTDTRHLFVDDVDNPYETPAASPFVWIRARHLGGRTVLWITRFSKGSPTPSRRFSITRAICGGPHHDGSRNPGP